MKSRKIIPLIIIFVLLGFTGFNILRKYKKNKQLENVHQVVPVEVIRARSGSLDHVIGVTGNLIPFWSVKIYPKVPGKVIEDIYVDKGDEVKKGELIAVLEKREINAQLKEAKANLKALDSQLDLVKLDYNRILNLFKANSVSKQRLDQIQTKLKSIQAKLKAAHARIEYLRIIRDDHNVYATADGIVVERFLDPGAFSSPSIPIVQINYEKKLKLISYVSEDYFIYLKKGLVVKFNVDGYKNKIFKGRISFIYPTIDPITRTVKIEVEVQNKDLTLRSGMFCHVQIYLGKDKGVIVPRDVLNKIPATGTYFVYIIKDNRAVLRNVSLGISNGNLVIVKQGISPGELVVLTGQGRLESGKEVKIVGQIR